MDLLASAADDDLTAVRIQLQWVTQAQFAGYYIAQELGFYEAEGLDVTILGRRPPTSYLLMSCLAGEAEFGVTWAPKVLKANENGANLINIAQIFQAQWNRLEVSFAEAGIEVGFLILCSSVSAFGTTTMSSRYSR